MVLHVQRRSYFLRRCEPSALCRAAQLDRPAQCLSYNVAIESDGPSVRRLGSLALAMTSSPAASVGRARRNLQPVRWIMHAFQLCWLAACQCPHFTHHCQQPSSSFLRLYFQPDSHLQPPFCCLVPPGEIPYAPSLPSSAFPPLDRFWLRLLRFIFYF